MHRLGDWCLRDSGLSAVVVERSYEAVVLSRALTK